MNEKEGKENKSTDFLNIRRQKENDKLFLSPFSFIHSATSPHLLNLCSYAHYFPLKFLLSFKSNTHKYTYMEYTMDDDDDDNVFWQWQWSWGIVHKLRLSKHKHFVLITPFLNSKNHFIQLQTPFPLGCVRFTLSLSNPKKKSRALRKEETKDDEKSALKWH